nr:cysteine dioxygenase type 1-like; partial [Biomphalaria glabrata]
MDSINSLFGKTIKVFKLEQLIQTLDNICYEDRAEDKVNALLESYTGNRNDWGSYADADNEKYTRHLVYQNNKFSLLILTFPPRVGNKIHGHGDSYTVFKVLNGSLVEKQYRRDDGQVRLTCRADNVYLTNEICKSPCSVQYHSVENHQDTVAISLVLYFPRVKVAHWYEENGQSHLVDLRFPLATYTIEIDRHLLQQITGENRDSTSDEEVNQT